MPELEHKWPENCTSDRYNSTLHVLQLTSATCHHYSHSETQHSQITAT